MSSVKTLQSMPLFGGISPEIIQLILEKSTIVDKQPHQYFFHEGESADALYIILDGKAIVKKDPDSSVLIGVLSRGDCFGEMGVIDHQPRSASVLAAGECVCLRVSLDTLYAVYEADLKQYAMLHMNMGREISRRLRKTDDELIPFL